LPIDSVPVPYRGGLEGAVTKGELKELRYDSRENGGNRDTERQKRCTEIKGLARMDGDGESGIVGKY
jgi:hypothetical protein